MAESSKRQRLDESRSTCNCLLSSKNTAKFKAVLSSDYLASSVILKDAVICNLTDKKMASKMVKELAEKLPKNHQLLHLKRIRNIRTNDQNQLQVVLCWIEDLETTQVNEKDNQENISSCDYQASSSESREHCDAMMILKERLERYLSKYSVSSDGLDSPQVIQVASRPPLSRAQYTAAKDYWPVSFHENKALEKKINQTEFSEEELSKMIRYCFHVFREDSLSRDEGLRALVIDPIKDQILVDVKDQRHLHPLQHVSMVAIDAVAKQQGGGAWGCSSEFPASNDCIVSKQHVVVSSKSGTSSGSKKALPYLCTGYDIYLSREPCCLCAMGLLHSRIGRVFYINPSQYGALGSKFHLHSEKRLNHHFDVYQVVL